jgi:hypothetical protein
MKWKTFVEFFVDFFGGLFIVDLISGCFWGEKLLGKELPKTTDSPSKKIHQKLYIHNKT